MPRSHEVTPILLAADGRSGTTALMALLGTDSRVAFDRVYPYENRYLTWLAKAAMVVGRPPNDSAFTAEQLFDLGDDRLGPMPRSMERPATLMPNVNEWTLGLWQMFTQKIRQGSPSAIYYAEKTPHWLAAQLRQVMPVRVLHLVRDPRDVYLSARKFIRSTGTVQFGLTSEMTNEDQARETAFRWLAYAENERADQGRDDVLPIRYEDWVQHPKKTADCIGQFLNLNLDIDSPELVRDHHRHSTSGGLELSVKRWQREPLDPAVNLRLVGLLAEHLDRYGYERPAHISPIENIVPDPAWPHSADGEWQRGPDGATVTLSGGDAWIELPVKQFSADTIAEVWLCLRAETGDHCSVYWRGPGRVFSETRCINAPIQPSPHYQVVRFRVCERRKWRDTIEQLRVDVCNGAVTAGANCEVRWIRLVP